MRNLRTIDLDRGYSCESSTSGLIFFLVGGGVCCVSSLINCLGDCLVHMCVFIVFMLILLLLNMYLGQCS